MRRFGAEWLPAVLEVVRDWFVGVRYGHGVVQIALDCVVVGPLVGCDPALVLRCLLLESRTVRGARLAAHVSWFTCFSIVSHCELIDLLQEERLASRDVVNVSGSEQIVEPRVFGHERTVRSSDPAEHPRIAVILQHVMKHGERNFEGLSTSLLLLLFLEFQHHVLDLVHDSVLHGILQK